MACGLLQRSTAIDGCTSWDKPVSAETMQQLHITAATLTKLGDPVQGRWLVDPKAPINVWVDASNIAMGAVLQIDGAVVEDAAWLQPKNDSAHINIKELDAAIRGINLAVKWGRRKITLFTDNEPVHGWLRAVIHRTHVKTRANAE